ncbi:hypothetical protein CORC01_13232 [Colletotrichum orchidophilum]|uniref:Gamma interferon inducible lysosomal thiol reductase n=1 Tax=Colletotrichum orchidophilum TaxID=1209926 RepID=A0A1G4AQL5_9PEZI|nr:uncharacterized protein CORC01_13232 [Colletotrichum orchidophilum]OHE91460.1 hypothetical protein CORC01_13232 [Colletotrichum orchidophilum]
MGAHRGCSEHRSVYRQQRQDQYQAPADTPAPPAPETHSYRYTDPDHAVIMDEKRDYYGYRTSTPPPLPAMSARMTRRRGILPVLAMAALFAYSVWNYTRHPFSPAGSGTTTHIVPQEAPVEVAKSLVPLEAHIMSKCPDARDCLRDLVLPTMVKSLDKVNFTLSYIGTPTENDGVDCKHGPAECMGNIIELCAIHLYPDPKINLGFTMCLSREYSAIPDRTLVEDCALEHAIDIKALDDCATQDDGGFGVGMLRDSVRRSRCHQELHRQTQRGDILHPG